MSGFKNDGIQVAEFQYDFAVHGGVKDVDIEISSANNRLPVGAIIQDCVAIIETAVVGSSSTVGLGNATSSVGYLTATAEATLVANYVAHAEKNKSVYLYDDSADSSLYYRVADAAGSKVMVRIGTANLTAGKFKVMLTYLNPSAP